VNAFFPFIATSPPSTTDSCAARIGWPRDAGDADDDETAAALEPNPADGRAREYDMVTSPKTGLLFTGTQFFLFRTGAQSCHTFLENSAAAAAAAAAAEDMAMGGAEAEIDWQARLYLQNNLIKILLKLNEELNSPRMY